MKNLNGISKILEEEVKAVNAELGEEEVDNAVTEILNSVDGQLNGLKKEEVIDVDNLDTDDDDIEVEDLFYVNRGFTLVSNGKEITLEEGFYISVDAFDAAKDDLLVISVYDVEGEIVEEDIEVTEDYLEGLVDNETLDFATYEEELEEGFVIRGGKKVKISAKMEKLKKKLAAKKGSGVNKFTIKDGKIVKKTAEQLKADKKKAKTFGKKMAKFKKKRAKSLKKSAKLRDGKTSGTLNVVEGFAMAVNGMQIELYENDVIEVSEGTLNVTRGGVTLLTGAACDDEFMSRCVAEGVASLVNEYSVDDVVTYKGGHYKVIKIDGETLSIENTETGDTLEVNVSELSDEGFEECSSGGSKEQKLEEGTVLTYACGEGYTVTESGRSRVLGNRARARAMLVAEGYEISAELLDKAVSGEAIIL